MAIVTIDGQQCEVDAGALIVEVAQRQGIDIPTFCYMERLAPLASCRMCLVEITGQRRLQPACATRVADGMVVRTDSDLVAQTRKSMLELLLANHPLDCPVCDKAGECELQDTVFTYGAGVSSFRDKKRVFRVEDIPLNKVIVFNANRCIQCQRCVRICEEVVGAVALGTIEKGMDTEVTGFANSLASCDHCGNCIEVCPVGALMSTPYRYKARPWDLTETDTICGFCGTGCELSVGMRDGRLARVRSKYETGVNGETLCVKGRFGLDFIDGENRVKSPMLRQDGALVAVSWEQALTYLGDRLKGLAGDQIGGLASARLNNESLYLFQKLMRAVLGTNNIDSSTRWAGSAYPALPALFNGLYARRPLAQVLAADCILVVGCNVTDDNPVTDYLLRGAVRDHGNKLFMASARPSRLDGEAAQSLRLLPGDEALLFAALMNGAEPPAAWREFLATAGPAIAAAQTVTLLVGADLLRAPEAGLGLRWLAELARFWEAQRKQVALQFLFDRPNQMGAWELGGLPAMLPGWRPVDDAASRRQVEQAWGTTLPAEPGADIHRMLAQCEAGEMGALYVVGGDPLLSYPDTGRVHRALGKLDLLVVQDSYLSATAGLADVVLPAAALVEEAGTLTNNQGKLQALRAVRQPSFETKPNGEIFSLVAAALGQNLGVTAPDRVVDEIARLVPAYGGEGGFTTAPGTVIQPDPGDLELAPAKSANGLSLVTGDCLFHSGYLSRHSATLTSLSAKPYVEIGPHDAVTLGLADQHKVIVRSGHGEITARVKINKRFPAGIVFVPENFAEMPVNHLLKPGQYPCPVEILRLPEPAKPS